MRIPVKRPALFGVGGFLLTAVIARLVAYFWPMSFRWHFSSGLHLHHYVFGIFILTIAGYLALVFKGPRATFGIALLWGLGVGLTYDEFGYWINPHRLVRGPGVRWDNTGLLIVGAAFVIGTAFTIVAKRRHRRSGPDLPQSSPR